MYQHLQVPSHETGGGSRYSAERDECKAHIPQMEAELEAQEANIRGVDQFLKVVDRYLDIRELAPEILHGFVECSVVHERSQPWKKKNYTQKVNRKSGVKKQREHLKVLPLLRGQKTSLLHDSVPCRRAVLCVQNRVFSTFWPRRGSCRPE